MSKKKNYDLLLGIPTSNVEATINGSVSKNDNGFSKKSLEPLNGKASLIYDGESHLLTIAPTGSGKGRSVIIPNLLYHDGPVIVIDPKGENYAVTEKRRRDMGHRVVTLDPFNVLSKTSDALNPFDIFDLENADIDTDAEMMAYLLANESFGREPFWDLSARGLFSGLFAYIAYRFKNEKVNRNLNYLSKLLSVDLRFQLASIIQNEIDHIPNLSFLEFTALISMAEVTSSSVHATANSYLKSLTSRKVEAVTEKSTFSLKDVVDGAPLSIYIIIPPDKLKSHAPLIRLWVGTLMKAISSRKKIPKHKTLFLLDECGQLGSFSYLETAITLLRGYGLQTWSFWQDLSQLKSLYPMQWPTIINNCGVVQIFGLRNYQVAKEFAGLVGIEAEQLQHLSHEEQVIMIDGNRLLKTQKLDYLKNPRFQGLYHPNPMYIGKKIR